MVHNERLVEGIGGRRYFDEVRVACLGNVHAVLGDLDCLGDQVYPEVIPVQVQFDEPALRCVSHAQPGGQIVHQVVLHERLVGVVAHERPVLVFVHAEDFLLFQELDLVAPLGHRLPGGIPAPSDGELHNLAFGCRFSPYLQFRRDFVHSVSDVAGVFRLDDEPRQACVWVFRVVQREVVELAAVAMGAVAATAVIPRAVAAAVVLGVVDAAVVVPGAVAACGKRYGYRYRKRAQCTNQGRAGPCGGG